MGFKSTWLVIIALLVVAMGIAAFVIEHVANEAQVRAVAEETNSQHADEQSGLPASVEWFVANEHPSDLTDLQRRHLAAQESTEVWSFYATVITGIAAILTLATLIFLRLSFREARRSADQAVEANRIASARSSAEATRRMPRPPPPAAALTIRGKPISPAADMSASSL